MCDSLFCSLVSCVTARGLRKQISIVALIRCIYIFDSLNRCLLMYNVPIKQINVKLIHSECLATEELIDYLSDFSLVFSLCFPKKRSASRIEEILLTRKYSFHRPPMSPVEVNSLPPAPKSLPAENCFPLLRCRAVCQNLFEANR